MTIQEAKRSWESRLTGIRGVQGVGIGKTKGGELCIDVYVYPDQSASDAARIPTTIEGHPVVVKRRGQMKAQ